MFMGDRAYLLFVFDKLIMQVSGALSLSLSLKLCSYYHQSCLAQTFLLIHSVPLFLCSHLPTRS